MTVHVLFFAMLREKMKQSEGDYEVTVGETVSHLARRLLEPVMENELLNRSLLFAVNNSYVDSEYRLQEGDEVAFIPPVAGG